MKNEEFDDAIRRKLEGIEPTYTGADIEKVWRYAARGRPSPWRWLKGNWYFLALSAAAMVGVTTWVIVSSRIRFNSGIPEKPITSVEIPPQQNDTLPVSTETSMLSAETITDRQPVSSIKPVIPKQNLSSRLTVQNMPGMKYEALDVKPAETQNTPADIIPKVPEFATVSELSAAYNPVKVNTETAKPDTLKIEFTDSTGVTLNKPEAGRMKALSLPYIAPGDTSITGQDKTFKQNHLVFSAVRLKTGMPVSNQSIGAGFGVELLAGQHTGISFGLRYAHTYTETFFTEDILRGHRHDRMGPDFHRRFDGQDVFIDISVSNSIIQMPFSLSYYIPLNHGYKMNFAIGSDLDLSVKQSVNFTHLFDSAGMKRVHIDAGGSVSPINTMYLAAGIEKEWGRLLLQLSPFISPHLRQVYYKPKQIEYGLDVNLKYRLWNNPGK